MKDSIQQKSIQHNSYPAWAPRFWHGMRLVDYVRLLHENRFQIDWSRMPMAAIIGGCSLFNAMMSQCQRLTHGARIRDAELVGPPVFVIGHWRSGTTLMHELLALDNRFAFPSNYDAFNPNHFLLSRFWLFPIVRLLMPGIRPMDNMTMGAGSPQEDDFALCAQGAPTPYRRIAFPNRPHRDHLLLDLANADEKQREQLRTAMNQFLRTLTVQYRKQLVLKSPPHTGRIEQLSTWFPDAKFIHISRHPYELVPSTMRLWRSLDQIMGLQVPRYDDVVLKNYIFECQDLMYSAYHRQRSQLSPQNLIEVRFEDLTANPVHVMNEVYQTLNLGDFNQVQPKIEAYFEVKKSHRQNQLDMEESIRMEIDARWPIYMRLFGYSPSASAQSA